MSDLKSIMERMAGAKPLSQFGDRIKKGGHLLALKEFAKRDTENRGEILAADFVVVESEGHKRGEVVGVAFFINDKGWQGDREWSRALSFVQTLIGTDDPNKASQAAVAFLDGTQPARGVMIRATGIPRPSKEQRKSGKVDDAFIEVAWDHIDQTPEQIKNARAAIEAGKSVDGGGAKSAQPVSTPTATETTPTAAATVDLASLFGK